MLEAGKEDRRGIRALRNPCKKRGTKGKAKSETEMSQVFNIAHFSQIL